jgi:hypothetical protein
MTVKYEVQVSLIYANMVHCRSSKIYARYDFRSENNLATLLKSAARDVYVVRRALAKGWQFDEIFRTNHCYTNWGQCYDLSLMAVFANCRRKMASCLENQCHI